MSSQGRGELSCVHTRATCAQREYPRRTDGNNQRAETVRNSNESGHATRYAAPCLQASPRCPECSCRITRVVQRARNTAVPSAQPG